MITIGGLAERKSILRNSITNNTGHYGGKINELNSSSVRPYCMWCWSVRFVCTDDNQEQDLGCKGRHPFRNVNDLAAYRWSS